MKRNASAQWNGHLKDGHGSLSTDSNVLSNTPYSFKTRFEQEKGTNPEELIAAALAGCFTMALAAQLEKSGLIAEQLNTTATVSIEKTKEGFSTPAIHLYVRARVPKAEQTIFDNAAHAAKLNCPIARLLNTEISLDAKLGY